MKVGTSKGAFVLATYQRPEILGKVLQSIYGANNSSDFHKVIVFQGNNEKSLDIINGFKDEATILIRVSGKDKSPLENITNNYLLGLEVAFEYLAVDYVIEVEDDSVIAPHTLDFIDQIYKKYNSKRKFRGINLGSYESRRELNGTYSLLRTGVHATHGVIVRRSWKFISRRRITTRIRTSPLDSTVEAYWKTGGYDETHMFAEDYWVSQKAEKMVIHKTKGVWTSARRFKNKGFFYMFLLTIKCYINRNNNSFFQKHHNYWI